MAYPKEREHLEYLAYLDQHNNGEGPYADEPQMTKEEWRRRERDNERTEKPRTRSSSILGTED